MIHNSVLFVLQICNELGIQDGVTVLDIVDLPDGDNRVDDDNEEDDWEPDSYFLACQLTWIGDICCSRIVGNIGGWFLWYCKFCILSIDCTKTNN